MSSIVILQIVQLVCPGLHHFSACQKELPPVVGPTGRVFHVMRLNPGFKVSAEVAAGRPDFDGVTRTSSGNKKVLTYCYARAFGFPRGSVDIDLVVWGGI